MSARTDSLKKAYQHGHDARRVGKPRVSSYQQPAWEREWFNGWDSADVYIKSGSGITTHTAETEGRYAYHAGKPNVAPAHWSTKLRRAWHGGWEIAKNTSRLASWCAPAPPWEQSPFAKAREDLLKLDMKVPYFMEPGKHTVKLMSLDEVVGNRLLMTFTTETGEVSREAFNKIDPSRIVYNKPCPIMLYESPCKGKFRRDKDRAYTGLTAMPLNKELNAMNSTLAFVFASLLPDVVSVQVTFDKTTVSGYQKTAYTYKTLKSQGIAVGDFVIVDSPIGGATMVKVTAVGTFEDLDAGAYQGYKWIVGKVDIADYTATTEKEAAFYQKVEELQRKAKAQKALEALAESLGGMDALKALMGELTPAADPTKAQDAEVQGTPPPAAE